MAVRRPIRRRGLVVSAALLTVLLVSLAVAATTPPVRRLLADPAGGQPVVGVDAVTIRPDPALNHAFDPPVIQVRQGTTVTWTFADTDEDGPVDHDVVGEGWGSSVQSTGTFAHTFDRPGTYDYVCTLHSFMSGSVRVAAD